MELSEILREYLPPEVMAEFICKLDEYERACKKELLDQQRKIAGFSIDSEDCEADPIEDDIKEDNKQRYADMKYTLRNCE